MGAKPCPLGPPSPCQVTVSLRQAIISAFSRTWVTRRAELRAEGKACIPPANTTVTDSNEAFLGHKWYKEQLCVCPSPPSDSSGSPETLNRWWQPPHTLLWSAYSRSALDLGSPFVHVLELPAPTSLKWSPKWSVSTARGSGTSAGQASLPQPAPRSPPFLLGSAPPHTPLPDYLLFSSQDQGPQACSEKLPQPSPALQWCSQAPPASRSGRCSSAFVPAPSPPTP